MTHDEALDWWFAHANYEQRAPAPGDLKLGRMRALLARLGQPQKRLRVVHVAGSKGKGSTSAMLAAVLRESGYRVGLFTSPHLTRLEERFQVDGAPITPAELTQLLVEVRAAARATPTFFEIATAVGFLHFVRRRVDAAVLEVGLGGRLDSTNVCHPAICVITSISFDHTRILGDRLALIAREKAGIIKPGRPVISGAVAPEARAVIEQVCRERHAPLAELGRDFRHWATPGRVSRTEFVRPRVRVVTTHRAWPEFELNLLGEHQAANAAVAVACVERLNALGWHVPDEAVARGLAGVRWPARMEVMSRAPMVVLDCAHNVASAEALVETLAQSFPAGRRTLVFAGSGDKDIAGMFRVLGPHFSRAVLTQYAINTRAVPADQLRALWVATCSAPAEACPDAAEALGRALRPARPEDLVCVTGSVFLAGEARPLLARLPDGDFSASETSGPAVG
ncbi:MAG: folylpolyglutamate synthase/dihydrofolate synthase family protein [Gemmataceae bacterium]